MGKGAFAFGKVSICAHGVRCPVLKLSRLLLPGSGKARAKAERHSEKEAEGGTSVLLFGASGMRCPGLTQAVPLPGEIRQRRQRGKRRQFGGSEAVVAREVVSLSSRDTRSMSGTEFGDANTRSAGSGKGSGASGSEYTSGETGKLCDPATSARCDI